MQPHACCEMLRASKLIRAICALTTDLSILGVWVCFLLRYCFFRRIPRQANRQRYGFAVSFLMRQSDIDCTGQLLGRMDFGFDGAWYTNPRADVILHLLPGRIDPMSTLLVPVTYSMSAFLVVLVHARLTCTASNGLHWAWIFCQETDFSALPIRRYLSTYLR